MNRKSTRKHEHDYADIGTYFVTICSYQRELIFADIVDEEMRYTEVGQIAYDCWLTTAQHFPHVTVDCFVVMPNHLHAIIIITKPNTHQATDVETRHASSLPETQPKRGIYKDGRYIPPGVKSGSLGAIVGSYKSAVTKIANRTLSDPPSFLWQKNYHDHIIHNETELHRIREYVANNPKQWDDDQFNW